MGRGYPATIKALGSNYNGGMTFVSVEIDNALIERCRQSIPSEWDDTFPPYRDLEKVEREGFCWWEAKRHGRHLLILPGNAVHTLSRAKNLELFPPLNAIYQDAFSPRKKSGTLDSGVVRLAQKVLLFQCHPLHLLGITFCPECPDESGFFRGRTQGVRPQEGVLPGQGESSRPSIRTRHNANLSHKRAKGQPVLRS